MDINKAPVLVLKTVTTATLSTPGESTECTRARKRPSLL
jgi:hypothetical protein